MFVIVFGKMVRKLIHLREKLPAAEPMKESIKPSYLEFIEPIKIKLDNIEYTE